MDKLKRAFFIVLFSVIGLNVSAQQKDNSSSNRGFNLSYSSDLGGFYFQDASGLQLAIEGLPYEGSIDEATYQLGANDLLTVEIKATQNIVLRSLLINSSGEIIIPAIGAVKFDGKTIAEAEEILKETASTVYKNPTVNISLEVPKAINVFITGSIPFPGKYVLPAQSRLDLAIMQSVIEVQTARSASSIYFPTYTSQLLAKREYSYRNITIEHADGSQTSADLVHYFLGGNLDNNPILRNGDQIHLKQMDRNTPKISISGAVSTNYDIEFKSGDTPSILLEISGGLTERASSNELFVFRASNSGFEKIVVPFENWDSFQLQANDHIIVPESKNAQLTAAATIEGEVEVPGQYPINNGETTVLELLDLSGGITQQALPNAAYLYRGTGLDNEIPNKFNAELMKRTSNQVAQGLDYLDLETKLSRNRVSIDLTNRDELALFKLFDGDRLYIPRDEQTVFVFGQVNNPGYFPYINSNSSIFDYIQRAGGFALSADKERVFIIKAGTATWYKPEETTLSSGDRIFVDRVPVEDLNAKRNYEIQKAQLRNQRTQLIMTGITTVTGIITTLIALDVIKR